MEQWLTILPAVLSVFAVIAGGALLRRLNWLTEEADESLLKLIIRVLVPCLILTAVLGNDRLRDARSVLLPPAIGFMAVAAGLLVSRIAAKLLARPLHLDPAGERTFAVCVAVFNYGYIPIPLVKLLFGDETLGVLFLHNVGVELALWTVVIMVLTGDIGRGWWRRALRVGVGWQVFHAAPLAVRRRRPPG